VVGSAIRVLLAGGEPIFLRGLQSVLDEAGGFGVVGACTTTADALELIKSADPDIVVSGRQARGHNALQLMREIRVLSLPVSVVIVSPRLGERDMVEALTLDVKGVLLDELSPDFLVRCLHKVSMGGYWFEHQSVKGALQSVMRREAGLRKAQQELTPREIELVCLVAEGLRNKEIGARLGISEATVKTHLRNIYKKLSRDSRDGRVALRLYAEEHGLV
jgi:DNA-binding NarL/FixJ family response regulator